MPNSRACNKNVNNKVITDKQCDHANVVNFRIKSAINTNVSLCIILCNFFPLLSNTQQ